MRKGRGTIVYHRAFAMGLLSHYVLDRNAHPFVYERQFGIIESDPELEDSGSQVHAVLESDLDVLMLQVKRDGATVDDYPPAGEIESGVQFIPPTPKASHFLDMRNGRQFKFQGFAVFDSRLSVSLVVHDYAVADIDHVVEFCRFGGRKVDASMAAHT